MERAYLYNDDFLHLHHQIDLHPKDEDFEMHIHDHYEIIYFVQGACNLLVEGTTYPLVPGNILLMRPTESHRIKILADKPYERYVIHFYPEIFEQIDPHRLLLEAFHKRSLGCKNLYSPLDFKKKNALDFVEAMYKPNENEQGKRLAILTQLLPLLNEIRSIFTQKETMEDILPQQTHQIIDYINRHLTDELSVNLLAKRFFLSPSQFSRRFKQDTGSSAWSYITIKRLMLAQNQLQNGVSPIKAALSSGFHDYSCFYRAYVNQFGRTPKEDINKISE